MAIEYRHNTASQTDILRHLKHMAPYFVVDLSTRVNLEEYAQKLYSQAELEEAWHDCDLIGLVAYYNNDTTQESFVSNVSVDIKFQKQGIASVLLNLAKTNSLEHSMKSMRVEVANDANLISYYKGHGFMLQADQQSSNIKTLIRYFYPLVAIRCTVFNHEPYLRDCLEGFVMQKTTFPFVAIVHDDASTDNSAAIIRKYAENYPDIIKPIYETENQWSKHDGSLQRIMNNAIDATGAKYVAMCEGDDYWIDPLKLQKQVDYMESHSECSMCFHGVQILDELSHEIQPDFLEDIPYSRDGLRLAQGNYIHAVSVMFRKNGSVDEKYAKVGRISMGDQILYHLYAEVGHFKKLPDIMGVYRVGNGQWSAASDAYRHLMSVISLSKTVPLLQNSEVRKQLDETIYQYANVVFNIINEKDKELLSIHNSRAYRIGTFMLRPARFLKKCIKKIKRLIKKIIGK